MSNDWTTLEEAVNRLAAICHDRSYSAGWWHDPETGYAMLEHKALTTYAVATKIALIHSEISEALEGHRTDSMDDKLSNRLAIEVELADAVIRIGDLAGALGLDLGGAIREKLEYNSSRPDHKASMRRAPGGKKY